MKTKEKGRVGSVKMLTRTFATLTLILLVSGSVSADWLADLQVALNDQSLSITSGGACGVTEAGGQMCVYPGDTAPTNANLLIVDPGIAKAGQTVKLILQVRGTSAPSSLVSSPLLKVVVKDAGGVQVDSKQLTPYSVTEWKACVSKDFTSYQVGWGGVYNPALCDSLTIQYTIPSSLKPGAYDIWDQFLDPVYKSSISAIDTGSFTVATATSAITCTVSCGAWQTGGCENLRIESTRICQTGALTSTGTACDSKREFKYGVAQCCTDSDCSSGKGVCSNNVCGTASTTATGQVTCCGPDPTKVYNCATNLVTVTCTQCKGINGLIQQKCGTGKDKSGNTYAGCLIGACSGGGLYGTGSTSTGDTTTSGDSTSTTTLSSGGSATTTLVPSDMSVLISSCLKDCQGANWTGGTIYPPTKVDGYDYKETWVKAVDAKSYTCTCYMKKDGSSDIIPTSIPEFLYLYWIPIVLGVAVITILTLAVFYFDSQKKRGRPIF